MSLDNLREAISQIRPEFQQATVESHLVSDGKLFVSAVVEVVGRCFSTTHRAEFFIPEKLANGDLALLSQYIANLS